MIYISLDVILELMVQKSGDHQLGLVVSSEILQGFIYITGGAGFQPSTVVLQSVSHDPSVGLYIPCVERFLAFCQVAIFCLPWALLVSGAAVGSDVLNGPVDVLAETALGNVAQMLELEYSALQGIRNTGSTLGCSPFL